ncbi:hypothetical protein EYF80_000319 [Liparis tanakae]|uniref:Uncharacterized protein n=1 Tax=Liparis tanakae TaxID=230148 RepID=A0A4Z2JHD5_9TELE|nr:hypothetical protein EYF80_000319 [Liparis tanakae]
MQVICAELLQPAIHRVKGMRTVGNVVDGAMPKQTMEMIPRRLVKITLRWSLMTDFTPSQNCKGETGPPYLQPVTKCSQLYHSRLYGTAPTRRSALWATSSLGSALLRIAVSMWLTRTWAPYAKSSSVSTRTVAHL